MVFRESFYRHAVFSGHDDFCAYLDRGNVVLGPLPTEEFAVVEKVGPQHLDVGENLVLEIGSTRWWPPP